MAPDLEQPEDPVERLRRLNLDPEAANDGKQRIGFALQLSLFKATYPGAYWQPWYPTVDHVVPWHLLRIMMVHRRAIVAQEALATLRAIGIAIGDKTGRARAELLKEAYHNG